MVIQFFPWSKFALLCNEKQQDELSFLETLAGSVGYCEHIPCIYCEGCLSTAGSQDKFLLQSLIPCDDLVIYSPFRTVPWSFSLHITNSTLCIQFRVYQSRREHIMLTVMRNISNQLPTPICYWWPPIELCSEWFNNYIRVQQEYHEQLVACAMNKKWELASESFICHFWVSAYFSFHWSTDIEVNTSYQFMLKWKLWFDIREVTLRYFTVSKTACYFWSQWFVY